MCYVGPMKLVDDVKRQTMSNLEDEIITKMGKQMSDEIDFSILADMLCAIGWRRVILSPMTWEDGYAVDAWTAKHIKGNFETMGLVWVFEREDDANWFTLRWL
jgi:hypothetical protein